MAINLRKLAQENAQSSLKDGKQYTKEDLTGKVLTIQNADIARAWATNEKGDYIMDDEGEHVMQEYGILRFVEYPDGYFQTFGNLTRTVLAWRDECDGDMDALNVALAENPIKIKIQPPAGKSRAWKYTLV